MNSSLRFLNFSPNSSKMNIPLAESTAIGSPLAKQFQGNQKRKSISPISSGSKRPGVKIDPHVLTDAQSNGIVSRLVKYYDQSNEPERSRTVYSKFGDFPLVQLKKTELKRPLSRATSVRIAPPNKTVMNPNLRAAIMRSSSFQMNTGLPKIAPTKMRVKDDSHKIITNHEPINDSNYPVSSKSVLDALEKNCRKRINNEELILDRSKKVCAPEVVDSPKEFMPISSVQQSAKRNREELSPDKNLFPTRSVLDSTSSQQSKRVKTRNNALLSSLSSSHYELPALSSTIPNNSRISSVPSSPKIVKKPKEVAVDTVIEETANKVKSAETKVVEFKQKDIEQPLRKLQLFNARPDPNAIINRAKLKAYDDNADEDDDEVKIRFVKPKEKVLENYEVISYVEKDKLNKMLKGLSQGIKSPVKEMQEKGKDTIDSKTSSASIEKQPVASISFTTSTTSSTVAPISTPASTSSAVISVNPPSILSNLVGEKKGAEISETKTLTTPSLTSTSSGSNASLTSSESTALPKPNIGGFQFGFTAATSTQNEAPKSVSSIIPTISTSSTTAPNTSVVSPMGIQGKPISPLVLFSLPKPDIPSSNVDPNKSLISFTPIKTSESVATVQPTISSTAIPSASFGNAGFKFGESLATTKNDNKPSVGFSFGNTAPTEKLEPKISGGFSFGASNTSAQSSIITSPPSFSFGSTVPKLPTTSPLLSTTTSQNPTLTFQNPTTTSASSGMLSFGAITAAPSFPGVPTSVTTFGQPATQTSVASFGQPASIGITSPLSSSAPSFNKQPETTVASGVGFSFGSTNKLTNSGFSFGSSAPTTTSSSGFAFGSPLATTAQSAGIFPTISATTAAPSFFGTNTVNTSNTTNSGFPGFGSTAVPKTEAQPSSMFSFGQKPQTAPVTTNSGFSFGGSMNNPTTALSAQPSQNSAFSFGQSGPTNNNENKSTGIFARLGEKQPENKPFSFGGNNTNTNNNNLQQTNSTFGSGNATLGATSSAPTIFGSAAAPSNTGSVFGQTPVLGNNNSTGNLFSTNNQSTNSPFGSASSQNSNQQQQSGGNLFAFGGPASTNNNANNQQQSSGMFSFGGSNNNSSNNNNAVSPISSNNIFGGATNNNNPGQNVSASFTFNPATGNVTNQQQPSQPTSPFGQQQQGSAPPPYQFGPSGVGNNVSSSFSFSGPSSAPSNVQTPPSNAQMFNFGNSGPPQGNFNFQGQQQTALPPQPSPGNLFNIGTGGNQQRRPARVATRRYK